MQFKRLLTMILSVSLVLSTPMPVMAEEQVVTDEAGERELPEVVEKELEEAETEDVNDSQETESDNASKQDEVTEAVIDLNDDETAVSDNEAALEEESISENVLELEEGELEEICDIKSEGSTVTIDGLEYKLDNERHTAILMGGEKEGDLIIPSSVKYYDEFYTVTEIGECAFYGCDNLTGDLVIPESVTSIGNQAFAECSGFIGLSLSENLVSIGESAFFKCTGLKSELKIPTTVKSIGKSAFSECSGLKGGVIIPDGVTYIGADTFYWCSGLDGKLVIPDSVKCISDNAFYSCKWLGDGEALVLPENLESIGSGAFYNCYALTGDLTIPDTVNSIGEAAFYGCTGFAGSLTLPAKLESIENRTFYGCMRLSGNVIIPDSVKNIGANAFNGCTGLSGSLTLPKNLQTIGMYAFSNCSGLTGNLTIPNSVTSIGEYAFSWCSGLNGTLTLSQNLKEIGYYAFSNCSGLTGNLTIPNSVTSIENYAFSWCSGLNGTLTLPSKLETINKGVFYGCSGLTGKLTIPGSVTSIGDEAFYGCSGLTGNLTIPNSVTRIGKNAFCLCTGLNGTLTLPSKLETIETDVFCGCSGLTGKLTIPDSVTSIGDFAFCRCSSLMGNLTIPNSVTSIGEYAFDGCRGLNGTLTLSTKLTEIKKAAFANCGFSGKLVLPEGLQSISVNAFCNCLGLKGNILLPSSLTKLDTVAFSLMSDEVSLTNGSSQSFTIVENTWKDINDNYITVLEPGQTAYKPAYFFFEMESIEPMEYTGSQIKPEPIFKGGGLGSISPLIKNVDYTLTYKNNINAGKAEITIKGKGNYKQSAVLNFEIEPKNISDGAFGFESAITATIKDMQYTGKALQSKPVIKYGKLTLKENKDYKLTYSGDESIFVDGKPVNPGVVTVTVEGINNYTGEAELQYRIYDKGLDFSKITVAPIASKVYTGAAIELTEDELMVYADAKKKTIISASDYIVMYENNTNVGTATAIIKPKAGNYADYGNSKKVTFKITAKPINQAKVENPNTVEIKVTGATKYQGTALKPTIEVVDKTTGNIIDPINYSYTFANNTNVASENDIKAPTVNVSFKKNYSGKASQKFSITALELTDSDVLITATNIKNATGKNLTDKDVKLTVKYGKKNLAKGKDYKIDFTYDSKTEWQEAVIEFQGNYTGYVTTKFKVYQAPSDISNEADFEITYADLDDIIYDGTKKQPSITVKESDTSVILVQGTDYTVAYTNNTNAAIENEKKAPTIKITGKGAYTGTVTKTFTIKPCELKTDDFTVTVNDMKYTKKALMPKVTVTNNDTGKTLKSGTDYTLEYSDNIEISDTAAVTITGKGNYTSNSTPLKAQFRIYEKDISTVYVDAIAAQDYKGKQIKPADINVYADKTRKQGLLIGADFNLEFGENIKAGTGTVIIKGHGTYGGTKTVKFVILPKWLEWLN